MKINTKHQISICLIMVAIYLTIFVGYLLFWVQLARAEDRGQYENVPLEIRAWYKSLRQPDLGTSCCDVSDCGPTDFQTTATGYRALVEGAWVDIPPNKVITDQGNPVGQAVTCYNKHAMAGYGAPLTIYCFVAGALL